MTNARELARLGNTDVITADSNFNVGIGSLTPDAKLDVAGIVSATSFYGSGANLSGIVAGADLSAGSGAQRVVVTSLTTGTMTAAATDADLSWNSTTNTLSAPTLSGNITGTAATFSGDVSIAGTITYEDVTNIDSVGVITSRDGIRVGASQSISPVSGTITYYGDGSNLDGVQSGVVNFVASGTIANGATVIIKDDGTVGIVTSTGSPAGFGSEVVFENSDMSTSAYCSVVHDTVNNKIVVSYSDKGDSYAGKAVVGTISGTSITFGTPVVFNSSVQGNHLAYVGSGKVVIAYQQGNSPYHSYAIVGTVSGTSISFGTAVNFIAGYGNQPYVVYDSGNDKAVILFSDGSNSSYGTAIVGTVSGTSISFGSKVTFNTNGTTYYFAGAYIGSSKIVIAYSDAGSSPQYQGKAIVGTVSGTSISFGTAAVFNAAGTGRSHYCPCISIGNDKVVIAYQDWGSTSQGAVVGTVSGTSISFGSVTSFGPSATEVYYIDGVYDTVTDKVFMAYRDDANSQYGTSIIGTVSGTSISFDSPVVFNTAGTHHMGVGYDSTNDKAVMAYADFGNSNYGTAIVYNFSTFATNLTAENYIGIAGESISNAATGKISVVGGVNSGQSGLTTNRKYYVATTGILTTTADTPSVVAGTSISDTEILVWKS